MLENMWESWNTNSLLVELWANPIILDGNLELCPKGYKNVHTLWPSNTAFRTVSQRDHKSGKGSHLYKNILALSVVVKNWKSRECPSTGERLNKLRYMNVMEYYCAIRNDEQEDFREAWKDLYDLMLRERSRNKRTSYTVTTTVCEDFFW